jgi:hypothetical protein
LPLPEKGERADILDESSDPLEYLFVFVSPRLVILISGLGECDCHAEGRDILYGGDEMLAVGISSEKVVGFVDHVRDDYLDLAILVNILERSYEIRGQVGCSDAINGLHGDLLEYIMLRRAEESSFGGWGATVQQAPKYVRRVGDAGQHRLRLNRILAILAAILKTP